MTSLPMISPDSSDILVPLDKKKLSKVQLAVVNGYTHVGSIRGDWAVGEARSVVRRNFTKLMDEDDTLAMYYLQFMFSYAWTDLKTFKDKIDDIVARAKTNPGYVGNTKPLAKFTGVKESVWARFDSLFDGVSTQYRHAGIFFSATAEFYAPLAEKFHKMGLNDFNGQIKYWKGVYRIMSHEQCVDIMNWQLACCTYCLEVLQDMGYKHQHSANPYKEAGLLEKFPAITQVDMPTTAMVVEFYQNGLKSGKKWVFDDKSKSIAVAGAAIVQPSLILNSKSIALEGKFISQGKMITVSNAYKKIMELYANISNFVIKAGAVNVTGKLGMNQVYAPMVQNVHWIVAVLRQKMNGGGQLLGPDESRKGTISINF